MRKILSTITLCSLGFLAVTAWAVTDYSSMTTEQLVSQRGSIQQASEEERNAFQNEWQKRVQQMTPSERQEYMGNQMNSGSMEHGSGDMERGSGNMEHESGSMEHDSGSMGGSMGGGMSGSMGGGNMGGGNMGGSMGGGMGGGRGGGGRR